ncbi:response regulator receiver domain-containing protein [Novosphingobium nitrogenifigens DSM 19370]|uniref:Response regulator receiver domain-containing protein n=1 Tax=Novosphingobium nitrogenifigens DSM 19370 TaxID=983920 RepID=F1ZDG2_9SPHN|nr:pilus assembly protein CpaE [Novosphingobium nitrogenifigens]EGD57297.1 response regulator receiver domain-containing protein [Novosphingobium nitrogenifigens DSM 19370]
MNAPWKSGNRDMFAAYVCDDASIDVLRSVVIDMGWQPEKVMKGGLRNAIQSLAITASPAILLVDMSESGDPLNDINALAEVCEPGTVVIAVGQVNDVRLYRDLLSSGIQDYLLKPLAPGALRDSLAQAQAIFTAPRNGEGGAAKSHVSTAIVGTRGGVGASMMATSLAWLLSTDNKMPTALLDLDVHFGTDALTLDLEPGRGLTDAIENPSRIDGLFIERAMIRANDNLSILSAEAPINSPLLTDGSAFVQLIEEFRHAFEATVIDLPRNMLINFPHLLSTVNVVLLVTELTLAGARDGIRLLSWLKSNAPHATVFVVANKVQSGVAEISKADFESSIERKINYVIPFDAKAAANAGKLGQTFIGANRAAKAGQAIRTIADAVVATDPDRVEAPTGKAPKGKDGGKGGGPRSDGDNGAGKSASLLDRLDFRKFLPGKVKTGAPA